MAQLRAAPYEKIRCRHRTEVAEERIPDPEMAGDPAENPVNTMRQAPGRDAVPNHRASDL
jgi:hypothetical protein